MPGMRDPAVIRLAARSALKSSNRSPSNRGIHRLFQAFFSSAVTCHSRPRSLILVIKPRCSTAASISSGGCRKTRNAFR